MEVSIHVDSFLGAGHYMTTDATLSNGVINAVTRTRSVTWFGGFTGGAQVLLVDANGVVIGTTNQQRYGVDGTMIGRSDRTDNWSQNIDPTIASKTAKLAVVHAWTPKVDVGQMVQRAIQIGMIIYQLIQEINNAGSANAAASS